MKLIFVLAIVALPGCNLIQSKEEACLQSFRLELKDPDSAKVVQNLGQRGGVAPTDVEFFWLRYKATNSFGAYISTDVACEKEDGKWIRAPWRMTSEAAGMSHEEWTAMMAERLQKSKNRMDKYLAQ